jgi:hypothetical protein
MFVLLGLYFQAMQPVWEKTPEGAREAAEWAERERLAATERSKQQAEAARRESTARALEEAERLGDELEAMRRRLERCFTTFGHRLPALENPVKENLHNPRAFEHVETVLIVPDSARNNVAMTFRAENGFGAVRTATVKAQLIADDCSVQNIGNPTID